MQFGKGILPAKEYLSNGLFSIQNCYSEAESSFIFMIFTSCR